MHLTSKKTPLIILGITAILSSRTMLVSLDDPEGPNLLIVMVMAAIVYFLSLGVYLFHSSLSLKRLILTILTQILIVTVLYFLLK